VLGSTRNKNAGSGRAVAHGVAGGDVEVNEGIGHDTVFHQGASPCLIEHGVLCLMEHGVLCLMEHDVVSE